MAQAGPQFTAAQILEAARRAEADGRIDYAVQFYRHLTDHLPRATETAAAREALARLAPRRIEPMNGHPQSHATLPPQAAAPAPQQAPMQVPTPQGPMLAQPQLQAQAQAFPPRQPGPSAPQGGISVAPVGIGPANRLELPPPQDHYRVGRLVARLTSGLGWMAIVLGLMAIPLFVGGRTMGLPKALGIDIAGMVLASGGLGAPTLLVSGLLLVFWSQLARALFDSANASRELVAIERAKAGDDA